MCYHLSKKGKQEYIQKTMGRKNKTYFKWLRVREGRLYGEGKEVGIQTRLLMLYFSLQI